MSKIDILFLCFLYFFPTFWVFFFLLSHQMHLCFITITFEQPSTFPQLNFHPVGQQHILSSLYLVVEGL